MGTRHLHAFKKCIRCLFACGPSPSFYRLEVIQALLFSLENTRTVALVIMKGRHLRLHKKFYKHERGESLILGKVMQHANVRYIKMSTNSTYISVRRVCSNSHYNSMTLEGEFHKLISLNNFISIFVCLLLYQHFVSHRAIKIINEREN